jgi:hypothetical protein
MGPCGISAGSWYRRALGCPRNSIILQPVGLLAVSYLESLRRLPEKGAKASKGSLQRDHSASATETLLRLLLPLNDQVWTTFRPEMSVATLPRPVRKPHLAIQSVVATGGVYKGQGRNQRKLMTCAY